jgi:hypothetical protein
LTKLSVRPDDGLASLAGDEHRQAHPVKWLGSDFRRRRQVWYAHWHSVSLSLQVMTMSKKRKAATGGGTSPTRTSLPTGLEERLQVVWQQLGHLLDWCDTETAWKELFCSEARPYRETFCWEAVAHMMSEYLAAHPDTFPDDALADCLIATQCPPCSDDHEMLTKFQNMWNEVLIDSQEEIDTSMQRDLELAQQEGNSDTVAAMYAADHHKWQPK